MQHIKSQPAIKRSEELVIPVSASRRLALHAPYKEQGLFHRAADAIFRAWRWNLALWVLATIAVAAYAVRAPREYEAEMTFLVNNNRADSQLSPDGITSTARPGDISDQQMATEIQILSSRELASKALRAAGLSGGSALEQDRALAQLQRNLQISPVLKANMIRVRYTASDPHQVMRVLDELATAYPDEHLHLHGNPGEMGFFDQQSAEAEKKLKDAGNKLLTFQQASGVVSAAEQKQMLLTRQMELQVALHQAEAELKDTSNRIASIKPRLEAMSKRISTQTRRVPNQYSLERMNTMLTELQNRRTELLVKYRPTERVVTQLDQQISDTKKALQSAEASVTTEEVSDVNPLRQALETEMAQAEALQAGLAGRMESMRAQDRSYRGQLARLETLAPVEEQYQRESKVAESNYLLYAKKREEARISQRMDDQKMANVVLAERPRFPVSPKSRSVLLAVAYVICLLIGTLAVGLFSRMKQTVETPWELEEIASAPVLGTVPVQSFALFPETLQRQL